MPVYDFACAECGKEREDLLSVSAPNPECCGKAMRKLAPTSIGIYIDCPAGSASAKSTEKHKAWMNSPKGVAKIKSLESEGYSMKKLKYAD